MISFKKYISSSSFQDSDRTVASTETNDTSTKRFDTQLFGVEFFEGVALSGGLHAHLPQKDIEKKVNLTEQSQDQKNDFLDRTNLILIL